LAPGPRAGTDMTAPEALDLRPGRPSRRATT